MDCIASTEAAQAKPALPSGLLILDILNSPLFNVTPDSPAEATRGNATRWAITTKMTKLRQELSRRRKKIRLLPGRGATPAFNWLGIQGEQKAAGRALTRRVQPGPATFRQHSE